MQVVTFEEVWPAVEPGGVYMVEDTFSSYTRKLGGQRIPRGDSGSRGGPGATRGVGRGNSKVVQEEWGGFGTAGRQVWHDRVKQLMDDLHAFR